MVRKVGAVKLTNVEWDQMVDEQVQNSMKVEYFIGSNLSGADGATGRVATVTNTISTMLFVSVSGLMLNSTRYTAAGTSVTFNIPIDDSTNDIVIAYLK